MQPLNSIHRRDFLKITGAMACGAMVPACAHAPKPPYQAKIRANLPQLPDYTPHISSIWVPRGEHTQAYDDFKKMVEAATDFSWLSAGDRVLLKLAMNSGNPYPATTDPWAVWCMVKLLREKGAGEIFIGDQSGVQSVFYTQDHERGSSRKLCETSGLLKTILEVQGTPVFFEERGYDSYTPTYPIEAHHWPQPLQVTSFLDEVDHIVYMPRVASHAMGSITSGFKLGVGLLREDSRLIFHQGGEHFYAMYEEIQQVPEILSKLRLVVSSGRMVLSTLGPDIGHVAHPKYGLIFASEDLLAHELMAYGWLLWNREFETPFYSHATSGRVTRSRSSINKGFVWWIWHKHKNLKHTPSMPLFIPGDIYQHPSISNTMKRMGGRPTQIHWEQVNGLKENLIVDFIKKVIEPSSV
jgi:uncharacterized protein (DUF362 family)